MELAALQMTQVCLHRNLVSQGSQCTYSRVNAAGIYSRYDEIYDFMDNRKQQVGAAQQQGRDQRTKTTCRDGIVLHLSL